MDFFARSFSFAEGEPPVIAEAGVNHNGDVRLAKRLIDVAGGGRADCQIPSLQDRKDISRFAELAPYQKENSPGCKGQAPTFASHWNSGSANFANSRSIAMIAV